MATRYGGLPPSDGGRPLCVVSRVALLRDHRHVDEQAAVDTIASTQSFRIVAILPAVLLLVFGAVWLRDKSKGGFKPEKI